MNLVIHVEAVHQRITVLGVHAFLPFSYKRRIYWQSDSEGERLLKETPWFLLVSESSCSRLERDALLSSITALERKNLLLSPLLTNLQSPVKITALSKGAML